MADVPPNSSIKKNNVEDEEQLSNPQISIELQYIKDLSFENPVGSDTPAMFGQDPTINVEVNTTARPIKNEKYEVSIFIRGEGKTGDTILFIVELTYAGLLTVTNAPKDALKPILLIEGARLLFPFARNIVAEVTRDSGLPPLFLNPIDFVQLYQEQQTIEAGGENGEAGSIN